MVDSRKQVAEEFCATVFDALFARPKDWSDKQAEAHIDATTDAVRMSLPRSRSDGLAVIQRAGLALKTSARTNAWPTTREVVSAVKSCQREVDTESTGPTGWPHRNSDFILEATGRMIRQHNEWPRWLEFPDEVAREIVSSGAFAESEIRAAGYRTRKERRL